MYKLLDLVLQALLIPFTYLVKKEKIIVFWSYHWLQYSWNPMALFEYSLENLSDYNCYWSTWDKELYNHLVSKKIPVIYKYSLSWIIILLKAKYLVIDHWLRDVMFSFDFWLSNIKLIQTWHGTPLKKLTISSNFSKLHKYAILREFKNYSLILSPSRDIGNIFKDVFQNQNVEVSGYPRNDILISKWNSHFDIDSIKEIVYAPTFRDKSTITPFDANSVHELDRFLWSKNYKLLIKLHPSDGSKLIYDWLSNITLVPKNTDIQNLLVTADILITDYSSVFFDFMLSWKPIVFYSFDYEYYKSNCRDFYIDYFEDLPWPFASNSDELIALLSDLKWFNDNEYRNKYSNFSQKFNTYSDGNASKRALKLIQNIWKRS